MSSLNWQEFKGALDPDPDPDLDQDGNENEAALKIQ